MTKGVVNQAIFTKTNVAEMNMIYKKLNKNYNDFIKNEIKIKTIMNSRPRTMY